MKSWRFISRPLEVRGAFYAETEKVQSWKNDGLFGAILYGMWAYARLLKDLGMVFLIALQAPARKDPGAA
jgi:hypothetical protein